MSTTKRTPVVIYRQPAREGDLRRLLPASLLSVLVHVGLIGLLLLLSAAGTAAPPPLEQVADVTVQPDQPDDDPRKNDPLIATDIDKTATAPGQDISFDKGLIADFSSPHFVNPTEPIGVENGRPDALPTSMPLPSGLGSVGPDGAIEAPGILATNTGGPPRGVLHGPAWDHRNIAKLAWLLTKAGSTTQSEAAVVRGLKWLVRNQATDGDWRLDGNFKDRGTPNNIAGTALALLPFLAAGKTHKPAQDNPYDKPVEKGLAFLLRKQDKRTGYFGGGMYAHGLATIALCEAYGMSQDTALRKPAQLAVNYIVRAQHSGGGWRYAAGQAGDTSVTGWQVMALKSAQMAGLDVQDLVMRRAQRYLDSCCDTANEGYGYVGTGSTPTMSAVGLLCRQYLQAWGPQNLRLIKGIDNNLKRYPPASMQNMYYYYYATQVMHHFGGAAWKTWNEKMRDSLVKSQDTGTPKPG